MIHVLTKGHGILLLLISLLCGLCFGMTGELYGAMYQSGQNANIIRKETEGKNRYPVTEYLDDEFEYYYMQNGTDNYKKLSACLAELSSGNGNTTFLSMGRQSLWVDDTVAHPAEAITESETDAKETSIISVQVSLQTVQSSHLVARDGRLFDEEDFGEGLYDGKHSIPVLLGSQYKGLFSLNDTFRAGYLNESFSFQVIGFLEEDSYLYQRTIQYLDNSIVMPVAVPKKAEPTSFHKKQLLDILNGAFESSENYDQVKQEVSSVFQKHGLSMPEIIQTSNGDFQGEMNSYLSLTNEVKDQYQLLVCLMVLLTVFTVSLLLNGFVRDGFYELCIYKLCGTSSLKMACAVLIVILLPVLFGDSLAFIWMINNNGRMRAIIVEQVLVVTTFFLASIAPLLQLQKLSLHEMLGGKE